MRGPGGRAPVSARPPSNPGRPRAATPCPTLPQPRPLASTGRGARPLREQLVPSGAPLRGAIGGGGGEAGGGARRPRRALGQALGAPMSSARPPLRRHAPLYHPLQPQPHPPPRLARPGRAPRAPPGRRHGAGDTPAPRHRRGGRLWRRWPGGPATASQEGGGCRRWAAGEAARLVARVRKGDTSRLARPGPPGRTHSGAPPRPSCCPS